MILLAVEPFGREFSLGTFSSLMSQPMARRQVWQTKITVLFLGAALIFAAFLVSCELRLHLTCDGPGRDGMARKSDARISARSMFASAAVLVLALVGGLWTVLLLRQIASAFWITFLAPLGILVTVALCLPAKYVDNDHVMVVRWFCPGRALHRGRLLAGAPAVSPGAGCGVDRRRHFVFHVALF